MLKQAENQSGAAVLRTGEKAEHIGRQVLMTALWTVAGLLIPRASILGGIAPFGVGLAAAVSGPGGAVIDLAVLIGYVLAGGAAVPLQYLAAVVAVTGMRWALGGFKRLSHSAAFAPVITFLGIGSVSIALTVVAGATVQGVLLVVSESLLAAGFSYFACQAFEVASQREDIRLTVSQQASIIAVMAVVLMAVATLEVGGISPGRILALLLILLLARCGREQGGSIAGIVVGSAMAFSAAGRWELAPAYALGGLLAGTFSRFGKAAAVGSFAAVQLIVLVSTNSNLDVMVGLYEVMAAAIVFLVLPRKADKPINFFFLRGRDIPALDGFRRSTAVQMKFAARAMKEVAGTVDSVSRKLSVIGAQDMSTVYRQVSEEVCHGCLRRSSCWDYHYEQTMDRFNHLTPLLREKKSLAAETAAELLPQCRHTGEIAQAVNAGFRECLIRESAQRRLQAIQAIVGDQFGSMADLLGEMAEQISGKEQVDTEAATRVRKICTDFGLDAQEVICALSGHDHMTIKIVLADNGTLLPEKEWREAINFCCGREFDHPVTERADGVWLLTMAELPLYRLTVGKAQKSCTGEALCGDAIETFYDGLGCFSAVLSDGMGSGGRAAVDGAMASGLTARLLKAGFGMETIGRMVNTALMVKSGDESLSTLDVASVNLFSGRLELYKAGAAVTLLRSHGKISRMEKAALPLGILREAEPEKTTDTLVDGDVLLMVSDGATVEGSAWIEEVLQSYDLSHDGVQGLADTVVSMAREKQTRHQDDISAIALYLRQIS